VAVEYHHPFEAGKRHRLNFLEDWRTNYGRMAEVNRDPEVFPLNHVRHQFVDLVKVVTEVLSEGLNVEYVQGHQVHSVEKTLEPILFEFFEVSLPLKVVFILKLHLKDVFVRPSVSP
jgi:hypothetical protein